MLTDKAIGGFILRHKRGTEPRKKLTDGEGLYLFMTPAKTPCWRINYRYDGKEKTYSIGTYRDVDLKQARAQRVFVRGQLLAGRDPMQVHQLELAAAVVASNSTFTAATEEWLAKRKLEWSDGHYVTTARALERDILPTLGNLPVDSITPPMVAGVIEKLVSRGVNETASKVLWNVRSIFELAQTKPGSTLRENPALAARAVLVQSKPHTPRPALLTFAELGGVLRAADVAAISPAVRLAHRLVAFSAARIANVVAARWSEFDLDGDTPTWIIPRGQMKMNRDRRHDHKVVLGATITLELSRWRTATGGQGYTFQSPHRHDGGHISKESLEKTMRTTMGYDGRHTVHGWRASFASLANDAETFSKDAISLTLDHINDNEIARAYDRGTRLEERVRLAYWWDTRLTAAQHGTTAITTAA